MRLSLQTLWELHEENDLKIIEDIHDYMFCDIMYTDVRYGIYYDARLDRIQLLPLKDTTMEKKIEKKKDTSKVLIDLIDLVKPTLTAAKAWIKHFTRGDK